ncbi:hypothetical protein Tco_1447276 [Tanacetum coccineum]
MIRTKTINVLPMMSHFCCPVSGVPPQGCTTYDEKLNPHAAGRARLTITDYVETDDDSQDGDLPVSVVSDDDSPRESFVAAQESSAVVSDVSAEPKSSPEGLQKKINNNLNCSDYADVVVSDDVKHKPCIIDLEKKNQEGDLPVAALRKNIDELLLAFELCFDPSSFENKKNQEAVVALKKNIEGLLSDFDPYPSEKKNQKGVVAFSHDAENEE